MMPEPRAYDSKRVAVVVGGIVIVGLAEGTFVEAAREEDLFESVVGGHGEVSTSETNDPRGTVTITVKQTSPQLPFLNSLASSKQLTSVWVYNNNDPREKAGGDQARARRPADKSFDKTVEDREFEFTVFDYQAT